MSVGKAYCQKPITVWTQVGESYDEFGNPVQDNNILKLYGGVDYADRIVRNATGEEVFSSTGVFLTEELPLNSWIYDGHSDSLTPEPDARRIISRTRRSTTIGNKTIGWWYHL
jgi:hypothetical protein